MVSGALGLALTMLIAIDLVVIFLYHAGVSARKRIWYRRWSKRLLQVNMFLTQAVLIWVILH